MATKDPATVAQEWASRLAQSGQKIQAGVQNVSTPPGQAAARQAQVWAANTAAAQAKWARNTAAVPLADWQNSMIQKGLPRIATGAQAAQPKFQDAMTRLLPYIDSQVRSLPARGNLEANINRMNAFVRGMANYNKAGS